MTPAQSRDPSSLSSSASPTSSSPTAVNGSTPPAFIRAAITRSSPSTSVHCAHAPLPRGAFPPTEVLIPRRSICSRLCRRYGQGFWRWLVTFMALLLSVHLYLHLYSLPNDHLPIDPGWITDVSHLHLIKRKQHDPISWLKKNSYPKDLKAKRPKALLISLVRNEELDGILQSMRQLEFHWNGRHNYPWVFFNERPFSEEFKAATSNATSARTEYHLVPRAHWITPPHINQTLYYNSLDYLSLTAVGKGHLLSYHAMIRWQSGLFYLHPALEKYDYYWRVEPDVHFFCDILYDPFAFMHENEMVYGFNMAILDDARSFASLWSTTRDFITEHSDLIHPDANLDWLLDPATGLNYNNCQFFSNFEIGSLNFFRDNEGSRRYFDWLEGKGGFYYSRWGDAPVHTLMMSMFTAPERVWWFRDIGYQHDIARHCPPSSPFKDIRNGHPRPHRSTSHKRDQTKDDRTSHLVDDLGWADGRCTCEVTSLDENFYKLVPMESPQVKPSDTCIRLWFGGKWLKKKEGWKQEAERVLGGDGYDGYTMDGM